MTLREDEKKQSEFQNSQSEKEAGTIPKLSFHGSARQFLTPDIQHIRTPLAFTPEKCQFTHIS